MPSPTSNLRGIVLMLAATAAFIINDSFLKFIMEDIPPYETAFLRAIMILAIGLPVLAATSGAAAVPKIVDPRVILRNMFELLAMLAYLIGLANAPIADMTALAQISPILLMLAAVVFFGVRIGLVQIVLAGLSFVGVLLVAQPGGSGVSLFSLFGLLAAVFIMLRDLFSRRVARDVPGFVVTVSVGLVSLVGAGMASLLLEDFVVPSWPQLGLILCSAIFVMAGHLCVFLAFRAGAVEVVAPFSYASTVWALLAGVVVFGTVPNGMALAGIALIGCAGVSMVITENRRRRSIPEVMRAAP